jgi:acetolactate synthase-1/2/3 large subunit
MSKTVRGADLLARALRCAGTQRIFSLSGNQIMPVYDASLDVRLDIVHVRHEGAAVHMADAWGRLTDAPGIAMVTGGPGHANAIGALYTALESDSPMVLLSGHAPLAQLGMGAFQEMRQADMAAPVVKASFTAQGAATLGQDIARAMRIAASGRPGPVHLSLPFDVLEAKVADTADPESTAFAPPVAALGRVVAETVYGLIAAASRPLVLTGPGMANGRGRTAREALAAAVGIPVLCLESPRGVNDPCMGALPDVLAEADLVVLVGKKLDFTLRFGKAPAFAPGCRFVVIDPDAEIVQRTVRVVGDPDKLVLCAVADAIPAAERLASVAKGATAAQARWAEEVAAAIAYRPQSWSTLPASRDRQVHPIEVGRAVQRLIDASPDAVLVADGGEFGQWAQSCVTAPTRIINGPAGSIGSAIPFATAARLARPQATIVAMLGDGTFGFHMAEMDTAVRHGLPFVAVVGNDACWNAEYQIQLNSYGRERTVGCELQSSAYDQVVAALGGAGECVTAAADLPAALERAAGAGKVACVNVLIDRLPAPTFSRKAAPTGGSH